MSGTERRIDMLLDNHRKKETRLHSGWLVSAVFLLFFASLMAPRVSRVVVFASPIAHYPASTPPVMPSLAAVTSAGTRPIEAAPRVVRRQAQSATVVRVPVVVTDALGRYVSGLEVEHFRVLEGGVEQTLAASSILVTRHAPISLAVIMDVHAGAVNDARDAAGRFLNTVEPDDEFFSIDSGGRPDTAAPSSLLDVVRAANDRLRNARHPLKGVVIISDGSEHTDTKAEAQSLAGLMDTPVFAINPKPTDDMLETLTKATGGRYVSSLDSGDLVRIGVALRNYYVLEFASQNPSRDGTYRPIEVQVVPPRGISRLFAQYRTGYFAPSR
jgi:Ca-activated chloride channel family protein